MNKKAKNNLFKYIPPSTFIPTLLNNQNLTATSFKTNPITINTLTLNIIIEPKNISINRDI